jgi:TetR/AcrR family transcriptional repressor of bet genes
MGRKEIKDFRRLQLIEATVESIARHGFAKTTLADVAKAARLSQGIVNFYFRSKKALLVETLRHLAAEYETLWKERVRRAGPSPGARLMAMIEADFDPVYLSRKKVTVWYAFWGESRWRPEFLEICEKLSDAYFSQSRAAMQEILDHGGYRDLDATALARAFNAMIDGLWLDILVNPKGCDREIAIQTCRAFLARAFPGEFAAPATAASAA